MIRLRAPLTEADVRRLRAGDEVAIDGIIYTARDMAHKRLCHAIDEGRELPIPLEGAILYFVGPDAGPAGQGDRLGRTDHFRSHGPLQPEAHRARPAGDDRQRISQRRGPRSAHGSTGRCIFATLGGAGALLSRHIVRAEVVAYEDLGTEAIRRLEVVDFPAVVAYDAAGGSVYDEVMTKTQSGV